MLKSALGPLTDLLYDPRVVEVILNADGVVWVERVGEGSRRRGPPFAQGGRP